MGRLTAKYPVRNTASKYAERNETKLRNPNNFEVFEVFPKKHKKTRENLCHKKKSDLMTQKACTLRNDLNNF